MGLSEFLLYLAVGRLLTWLLQVNGLTRRLWRLHPLLTELGECDLCLGFWIYLTLSLSWRRGLFAVWPRSVESAALAAIATFAAHLLRLGWQSKFGVAVIE